MVDAWAGNLLAKYEEERGRLTRRRTQTAALLGISIIPFYGVSDYLLYPRYFRILLMTRVLSVLLGVASLTLVRSHFGESFPYLIGMTLGIGFAMTASGVPVFLLGYGVVYYVGCIVVIFGMALLLPWRFVHAAGLSLALLAMYIGAALLHGSIPDWPEFVCYASIIGASIGIALVGMTASEALRLREFRSRVAFQDEFDKKCQLAAALAEKTAKLESLNREMEDLLYVASHDLRAPLINVQGFSRELQIGLAQLRSQNGKSPETSAVLTDTDESLQFILTAVARMDSLINSLLSVSRITTRTNPTEQVDLNGLVVKLAASFHYQLTEKQIALEWDPLPVVVGDPVRLGQLFGNLIDNAIKYMGDRPVRRIHVGVDNGGGERRFFVRDTGPGIPRDEHEQVFRLFRRLANGDCPGEGIGLAMVRKIVEKHGGKIWVDPAAAPGATFWFTLQGSLPVFENGGVQ